MTDHRESKAGKARSIWADKPYAVGKGKPPVEHQFKKGGPSPNKRGRLVGSKNKSDFEKIRDKRVRVGVDSMGRPVYKTLGQLVDHQLLKLAAEGNIPAIRIFKDVELRLAALRARSGPDANDIRVALEQDDERRKAAEQLSAGIAAMLNQVTQLKKAGIMDSIDGNWVIASWVHEAASRRVIDENGEDLS